MNDSDDLNPNMTGDLTGPSTSARPALASRWRATALPTAALVLVVSAGFAACGSSDTGAYATLPAIITTTSTAPTTAFGAGMKVFYKVKSGDSLATIAAHFHVPVQRLKELNAKVLPDPNKLFVGITLQIPTDVLLVDTLPPLDTGPPTTAKP